MTTLLCKTITIIGALFIVTLGLWGGYGYVEHQVRSVNVAYANCTYKVLIRPNPTEDNTPNYKTPEAECVLEWKINNTKGHTKTTCSHKYLDEKNVSCFITTSDNNKTQYNAYLQKNIAQCDAIHQCTALKALLITSITTTTIFVCVIIIVLYFLCGPYRQHCMAFLMGDIEDINPATSAAPAKNRRMVHIVHLHDEDTEPLLT